MGPFEAEADHTQKNWVMDCRAAPCGRFSVQASGGFDLASLPVAAANATGG